MKRSKRDVVRALRNLSFLSLMSTVFHVYYRQLLQKTAMVLVELNLYEKVIIMGIMRGGRWQRQL
jgi:hypothetical protein